MKHNKVSTDIGIAIMEAINAGICADVPDNFDYGNVATQEYIHSQTEGYELTKTVEYIRDSIRFFNRASKRHSQK